MPQILDYDINGGTGTPGADGAPGRHGGGVTIVYEFSTTTADADPGSGLLRLSNATQNIATVIRADLLDKDGNDWSAALATLADSTSAVKGHIRLVSTVDQSKFILFAVGSLASPSGYKNITVTPVAYSAANPFANGDEILLTFTRTGDKGDTGATGGAGSNGSNGTNGNNGNHGGAITIRYLFSTTTTDSDPGSGNLRVDNANFSSAGTIFADLLDTGATDWTAVLDAMDVSSNINNVGTIRLVKEFDATKWYVFTLQVVTTATGYRKLLILPVGGSGTAPFSNGDAILLCFTGTGDTGDAGTPGINGDDAFQPPNMRLTLVSGNPIGIASNVSTLYCTPYFGNKVSLYNGSSWVIHTLSAEISVAIPSTLFRMFDVFIYDNGGTLTLETANWSQTTGTITNATNATPIVLTSNSHGNSAGDIIGVAGIGGNTAANGEVWQISVAGMNSMTLRGSAGNGAFTTNGTWYKISGQTNSGITTQNGVPVKTGATNKRFLGIGMTTGVSGQCTYEARRGWLTNLYNQIDSVLTYFDTTAHTLGATGTRPWNNDGRAYISYVVPYFNTICEIGSCHPIIFHSATTGSTNVGFGNQNNATLNRYVVSTTSTSAQRYGCTGFTEYTEGFSWSGIVEDRLTASTANFTQVVAQLRVKR